MANSIVSWRLSSSPLVELTFTGTTLQHVNLSGHASPVTACNRLPPPLSLCLQKRIEIDSSTAAPFPIYYFKVYSGRI